MANIVPALTWLENERVWVWIWQAHSACKRATMKVEGREGATDSKKSAGTPEATQLSTRALHLDPGNPAQKSDTERSREPSEAGI